MPTAVRNVLSSGITHVVFAFIAMGSWAFFANSSHAMPKPAVAALVQGTLSACITLFMKRTLDLLSAQWLGAKSLYLPPLLVCGASLGLLVLLHILAETPEPLRTIALPFAIATTYAISYNLALWRGKESHG